MHVGMHVDVPGGALHVAVDGEGPPVVMLMGAGAPGRVWQAHHAPALRALGYSTWVVDWRGTGRSSPWAAGYSWAACVDDVDAVLGEIGPGPAAIVGTSMGARVAVHLAERRPDDVAALVLLALGDEPGPAGELYARAVARYSGEAGHAGQAGHAGRDRDVWAAIQALALSPATLRDPVRGRDFVDMLTISEPPRGASAHFGSAIGAEPVARAAARVRCPAHVVAFADDIIAPVGAVSRLAAAFPRGTLRTVPDAGHLGYLEQEEATAAVIADALAGTFPVRGPAHREAAARG